MPIFRSRRSKPDAEPKKAASDAKSKLERQVEQEVIVMCIAMPFLPKDQVRGLVLKKLGLETERKGKTIVRAGGAR